eukprot:c25188_g1_i1 orf=415-2046(-)
MEAKDGIPAEVSTVNPSPKDGIAARIIDVIEKAVVWMLYDSSVPLHFLSGNFAPAPAETEPQFDLPVIGTLPSCLNGEFVRVGPNPKFRPVANYHWFDGDGMVHGLRIKDGKATYVSRYVQTSRLKQEEYYGAAKFLKIGDLKGIFGLLTAQIMFCRSKFGVLDVSQGFGTGNTALVYHDGKLLALNEGDKPYALRVLEDGDLQTVGLLDYEKRLTHPFTAHPKVDPMTGELFTFGYQSEPPYCTYHVVSKDGTMGDPVIITVSGPVVMHDFAITENYAIFMDLPLSLHPKEIIKGTIMKFDTSKKARFGILPRYAKNESQIQWFELPTCYIFHNANAWEEGDEIVLYSCRLPDLDLDLVAGPVKENIQNYQNELYELRFDLKTGLASQKQLSVSAVDFPRINEKYLGRRQQFVYGTILEETTKVKGVAKFDLWAEPKLEGKQEIEIGGNVKGVFFFGPGKYGSEAIFVPRTSGVDETEDDGYLICFVHDENSGKSEVAIYDAKTMAPEPVGVVLLASRVPYGFHAIFVSEEQLQSQKLRYRT